MLTHNDPEPTVLRPVGATMKPIDEAHREALRPARIDPTDHDPKVKKAQAKLDRMIAADAPGSVLTKCRAAVESARTAILERVAEARHKERSKILADQRETKRLEHERSVLFRMDESLTPQITVNYGPLSIRVSPEKAMDNVLRSRAYGDFHRILQLISTETQKAAGLASHAKTPLQVLPLDLAFFKRLLEDVGRESIAANLMTVEVID